ncbi:MAG: SCO family protein [Bacteroidetes bacterium]|nr:SCO family protein [Bacteroidota bacterium]
MKKIIIVLAFISFFVGTSFAQIDKTPEVGIIEHLNENIPLDLKFVNDKFDTVSLSQLLNKPTILSFVYFDCPGLCSPLLEGIGDVMKRTDLELGKDYQVITISFNFRDTPQKAKEKKERFIERYSKGKGDGWIFLTTDSVTIFKITDAAGFKTKAVGLDFIHPSAIIALSPKGKITRYLYGINFLPIDFKMAIIEANKGQSRPTIQKIMQICYSYDPENKHFTLDILKISATIIIFMLLILIIVLVIKRKLKNK